MARRQRVLRVPKRYHSVHKRGRCGQGEVSRAVQRHGGEGVTRKSGGQWEECA